jgi:quinol monooxygenase YgiN
MFQAIAVHHARAEHVEDFLAFMHRVVAAVGDPPGLIEFTAWRDTQSSRLVAVSRWDSEADFRAALPTIMSMAPERRDEWSERPDELVLLEEAAS